jgi:hypothetical protein
VTAKLGYEWFVNLVAQTVVGALQHYADRQPEMGTITFKLISCVTDSDAFLKKSVIVIVTQCLKVTFSCGGTMDFKIWWSFLKTFYLKLTSLFLKLVGVNVQN